MKTESAPPQEQAFTKLRDLIADIQVAMLSTVASDGTLRSRPMVTQHIDIAKGSVWFFTNDDSPKVEQLFDNQQVGLAYAAPAEQIYVSVSGCAHVVRDNDKAREFWTPWAGIWFPAGVDDPNLALIRVDVEAAEYWDSPSNKIVLVYGLAKIALTGKPPEHLGENVKMNVP